MEKKNDTLQSQGELKRKLGLGAALAVAVGSTIGSGIFSSLAEVAGASGSAMMMIATASSTITADASSTMSPSKSSPLS